MRKTSAPVSDGDLSAELDRARKREAATSEILDMIRQSRGDEKPVFDAILHRAADLCGAYAAALTMGKAGDTHQRLAAHYGVSASTVAAYEHGDVSMDPEISIGAKAILTGKLVHVEDMAETDGYRLGVGSYVSVVKDTGARTEMIVPLVTDTGAIGAFIVFRKEVRPFRPDEIALVETFAAQAVIAIENARQFRELQARLAREAATREILEVISQSRDDDAPVFDVIVRNAARLCDAPVAWLMLANPAKTTLTLAAYHGLSRRKIELGDTWQLATEPETITGVGRAIFETRTIHEDDLAQTEQYRSGEVDMRLLVDEEGIRTRLSVPLTNGAESIGVIVLSRRDPAPFRADQITLVETFAAQAVIAIENVHQFRELQERLAREAATREILEVISQSREDDRPVFEVVLRKAAELCGASMADLEIISEDRSRSVMVAHWGETLRHHVVGATAWPIESALATAIYNPEGRVVHVHDLADTDLYRSGDPNMVADVDGEGIRTFLAVPLFSGGKTIGCIVLYRREVNPFNADEIALIETFAAQAVIAIENVRQFRELQTRLAREAATREILEVISQSREDDRPVFDVVLRKAAELCGASMAGLNIISEDRSHAVMVAEWGDHVADLRPVGETVWPIESDHAPSTCMREGRIVHVHDLADTDLYRTGDPIRVTAVDTEGIRTFLAVPLFSGGKTESCISIYRREVRPFTPDEIALVETFAAQAVIAIENTSQFRELQARLAREAATREILEVISQSRDDDRPVFEMVLRKAAELCHASLASLFASEDRNRLVVVAEWGEHVADALPAGVADWPMDSPNATSTCIREGRVVHIHDMADTDLYRAGDPIRVHVVDAEGMRTLLVVPLLRGGKTESCISIYRREVRPFTADEIALVETFAAQAVIAIENVRQFRELQTRLAREAATREILEVISQSRDDERPVFEVVLRKATELCGASLASLSKVSEDRSYAAIVSDWGEMVRHFTVGTTVWPMDSLHAPPTAMREGRVVHIHDMADTDLYRSGDEMRVLAVDKEGIRTFLAVPLLSGGRAVGCIAIYRLEVRPFDADQIALVETFAAQAVIAIENVRQFRELRDSLEKQEATSDILRVISQSREDETQVFDLILEKAAVLCNADQSSLLIVNEARTHVRHMADWGHDRTAYHPGLEYSLDLPLSIVSTIRTAKVVHIEDYSQSVSYKDRDPIAVGLVETEGVRTRLNVPLLQYGIAIGCISLSRRAVRPFTPYEIALVETFAAQAVIAIENVRQFRELQGRLAREAATREILEVISQSRDDDAPVFDAVLRNANRLCGTSMAYLVLGRPDDTHMTLAAYVNPYLPSENSVDKIIAFANQPGMRMDAAEHFSAKAILSGEVVQIADIATSQGYLSGEPTVRILVEDVGVRTILSVPMFDAQGAIGAISLQRREERLFSDDEITLIQSFAAQAAIAIENVRQFKALETLNAELGERVQAQVGEIERMGRLKRFLPAAVANAVVSSGSEKMLSSHRALLGVLFADIRGFTSFCETAEPEETIEVLQTYHEEMGRLINDHGAGVDHRMGDGIMVLFNDPLPCNDPAGDAVRLAMAMRARMAELCIKWKRSGYRLGFGLGVSLGYATVGMVGAGGRSDYTASGTAINLASRLCDEAQDGEILISPRARTAIEDDFTVESRGEINFKGIREPVEVFCVTGVAGHGVTPQSAAPP